MAESGGIMGTYAFAVIIVFLALAALFESFRDPLVILISVPLSIAGALIFIALGVGGASLNIYTEVGLVTLMGLISKHGILIVEVANTEQQTGKTKQAAIVAAAGIRLRPILMTTAAMVLGVIPLVFASGAGAASRFAIGLVISTGLSIGTCSHCSWCPGCTCCSALPTVTTRSARICVRCRAQGECSRAERPAAPVRAPTVPAAKTSPYTVFWRRRLRGVGRPPRLHESASEFVQNSALAFAIVLYIPTAAT